MSRWENRKYSAELKLTAVQAYQAGEGSLRKICRRYGIKEMEILLLKKRRSWKAVFGGRRKAGASQSGNSLFPRHQEVSHFQIVCRFAHSKMFLLQMAETGGEQQ